MQEVLVCDKMGWTHYEYISQPAWFIQTLFLKWSADAEFSKRKK
jgi:hypothetical protein